MNHFSSLMLQEARIIEPEHYATEIKALRAHPLIAWFLRWFGKTDFVCWVPGARLTRDVFYIADIPTLYGIKQQIFTTPGGLARLRKALRTAPPEPRT